MIPKLNESTERVVAQARTKAAQLNHAYVDTDHIMLALLSERQVIELLLKAGVPPERLSKELERCIKTGSSNIRLNITREIDRHAPMKPKEHLASEPETIPLSAAARKALSHAQDQALKTRGETTVIAHLLLGMLEEPTETAAVAIRACNIEPTVLKENISNLIAQSTPPEVTLPRERKGISFISGARPERVEKKEAPTPVPVPSVVSAKIEEPEAAVPPPSPGVTVAASELPSIVPAPLEKSAQALIEETLLQAPSSPVTLPDILEESRRAAAGTTPTCNIEPIVSKEGIANLMTQSTPPEVTLPRERKGISFISGARPERVEKKEAPTPVPVPSVVSAKIEEPEAAVPPPSPGVTVAASELPPIAPAPPEESPEAPVEKTLMHEPSSAVTIPGAEDESWHVRIESRPERTKRMFGTAGVRGVTNIEITPALAMRIAEVFGDQLGNTGSVAVGHDTRYGALMLSHAAMSGLQSAGIDVHDCGCIPTPGLISYVTERKLAGGIMLTGSHMPIDRMGIIVVLKDGAYAYADYAAALEKRLEGYESRNVRIIADKIGKYKRVTDALESYRRRLVSMVDRRLLWGSRFRVLVDPGNGTSTFVLPDVLRDLSCIVFKINEKPSPEVNRSPEPRADNLKETAKAVVAHKCALGAATDIDADRVLFIDANGKVISEDTVGCIFIKYLAPKGVKVVVTPVNSSGVVEHTCKQLGLRLEYCGIGQPATIQAIKALGANFSYEESGKYYFCDEVLWPDGLLATIKLLEIMASQKKSLAELAAEFPTFYQVKHTIKCPDEMKSHVMDSVSQIWKKECVANREKDVTIDGLKRVYSDNSWLLIRASGTEPLIRIYSDAPDESRAQELVAAGEEIVRKAMS